MCAGLHLIPGKKQIRYFLGHKEALPTDTRCSKVNKTWPQGFSVIDRRTLNRLIQKPVQQIGDRQEQDVVRPLGKEHTG